ncbi:MAG: methylated-DNA--[protein]-cysteine S-methyltransferase [Clostridia bacterium]|nr:methylated-DNA--[protein]-cysteine S-methyltransferase [Clostridia bacterium]
MTARILPTPLGDMLAAAEEGALRGLWFLGQRYFPPQAEAWLNAACDACDAAALDGAQAWLAAYFAGRDPVAPPKLAPRGTAFQQRVWAALQRIPRGHTVTYAELAGRCASAPRAVGGAVGRNPISLIVPCHRVVGANSSLTGYAGGLERKAALLALEGVL